MITQPNRFKEELEKINKLDEERRKLIIPIRDFLKSNGQYPIIFNPKERKNFFWIGIWNGFKDKERFEYLSRCQYENIVKIFRYDINDLNISDIIYLHSDKAVCNSTGDTVENAWEYGSSKIVDFPFLTIPQEYLDSPKDHYENKLKELERAVTPFLEAEKKKKEEKKKKDELIKSALSKLTPEEREALGKRL